jgi:hypothetical protein
MNTDGCTRSSLRALFSMKAAHNCRGVMPLASAAATKLPADTPTYPDRALKSTLGKASCNAHKAPIS